MPTIADIDGKYEIISFSLFWSQSRNWDNLKIQSIKPSPSPVSPAQVMTRLPVSSMCSMSTIWNNMCEERWTRWTTWGDQSLIATKGITFVIDLGFGIKEQINLLELPFLLFQRNRRRVGCYLPRRQFGDKCWSPQPRSMFRLNFQEKYFVTLWFFTCSNFGKWEPCPSWRVFWADHKTLEDAGIPKTNCPSGVSLMGQLLVALVHGDIFLQFLGKSLTILFFLLNLNMLY